MFVAAITRKSCSTVSSLASRLSRVGVSNYHSAIFKAVNHHPSKLVLVERSFLLFRQKCYSFFSTVADTKSPSFDYSLLRVIESEIQVALESDDHDRVEETPERFPFNINDNAGQKTVVLTREYEGELVKVEVHMPDLVTGEDNDVHNDDSADAEMPTRSSLPLVVTVSKKAGVCLEFSCVGYPDEIAIDCLSVRKPGSLEDEFVYTGPNFHDLDQNLRKAFHKYLEIRGVKPSTINFLHEYMINKDSREYLGWLQNLKKFVEA